MIGKFRERFGAAGLVVAVIALIAALAGTAFAAAKLNSTQKKEVEKIAKKFAGKPGKPGKNGAPGAPGPVGPAGANGKDGVNGTNGTNGTNGKSVAVGAEAALTANCEGRGGAWVQVEGEPSATRKYACNGKEGSPWTAGGVLPSGKTETGTWALSAGAGVVSAGAITFALPLANTIAATNVHLLEGVETDPNCPGSGSAPGAAAGHLCIWVGAVENATIEEVAAPADIPPAGASRTGAVVLAVGGATDGMAYGTFAVTAP